MENKTLQKRQYARSGMVYTYQQIVDLLDLRDSPSLGFKIEGKDCVLQDAHVTEQQLLAIPGFAETKWLYQHETHEWIPVFDYASSNEKPVTDFVDFEPSKDPWETRRPEHKRENFWCTPKGFPRPQYDYEADKPSCGCDPNGENCVAHGGPQ